MGADAARGRASLVQGLHRGPLSGQDALTRGVVPLYNLRRVLPLQLPRQWKGLLSESQTTGVQDLPFRAGGECRSFSEEGRGSCGSHTLKSGLHLALCSGVRGDRAFFRSPRSFTGARRLVKKAVQQGRSKRRGEEVHTALRVSRSPIKLILVNG